MGIDPNRDLGPFVEGLVMALLDHRRLDNLPPGWRFEESSDPQGTHAIYFISPSGLRWRVRAVLEESPAPAGAETPEEGT